VLRRLLILLPILALVATVWLRDPPHRHNSSQIVAVTPLALPDPVAVSLAPFSLTGAWRLTSANSNFGGYSALVVPAPGWLRAYSDLGQRLELPQPGRPGQAFQAALFGREAHDKSMRDVEAASRDPRTGETWLAAEGRNALLRLDSGGRITARFAPPAMRRWPVNSGAEAMLRRADGSFLILAEAYAESGWTGGGTGHEALRFAPQRDGGPGRAERFSFIGPAGFRPTDMAELPDGRILVLTRRLRWPMPPRFGTQIVLADPRQIAPGRPWRGTPLVSLEGTGLEENYEGLAIEPLADGRLTIWLTSDANGAVTQRTLLLRLELDPANLPGTPAKQKAPD
jgi:hypothetical protein